MTYTTRPAPQTTSSDPDAPAPGLDSVTGVLERITYHNEENGYTVARLAVEGERDLVTIVGSFSNPIVGEMLVCEGRWSAHRDQD